MTIIDLLSDPARIMFMIPVVAIVTCGTVGIVKSIITHRERMAMIEMGIGPDHVLFDEDDADLRETASARA